MHRREVPSLLLSPVYDSSQPVLICVHPGKTTSNATCSLNCTEEHIGFKTAASDNIVLPKGFFSIANYNICIVKLQMVFKGMDRSILDKILIKYSTDDDL